MTPQETGNWQKFLRRAGFLGANGIALTVDEQWGGNTSFATRAYQSGAQLPQTGVLDDATRAAGMLDGFIPFVLAKRYGAMGTITREFRAIIIHTMEAPMTPRTAHNVATWFAGSSSPQASAHYAIDCAETIQMVRDHDVAWHASQVNPWSIGIEHAGYAKQTAEEWGSLENENMLLRSANLCAQLCTAYGIPPHRLTDEELRDGKSKGFAGHNDVTRVFNAGKGHWDPGPAFPFDHYLDLVTEAVAALSPETSIT